MFRIANHGAFGQNLPDVRGSGARRWGTVSMARGLKAERIGSRAGAAPKSVARIIARGGTAHMRGVAPRARFAQVVRAKRPHPAQFDAKLRASTVSTCTGKQAQRSGPSVPGAGLNLTPKRRLRSRCQ